MEYLLDEQIVGVMIEMADKNNKGFVNEEEFIGLMKDFGIIHEVQKVDVMAKSNK